jgi:hypothetical protein
VLGTGNKGCEFYPTVTINSMLSNKAAPGATGYHFSVAIGNPGTRTASYTITRGPATIATGTVAAGGVQIVQLPWVGALDAATASALVTSGAYRLVADRPVTVSQYNPLEYISGSTYSYTNDASLLLPVHVWTNSYFVAARNTWSGYSGFYSVVASQDGTTVSLTPSASGRIIKAGGGVSAMGTGSVALNRGDVLQVLSATGGGSPDVSDVTGTRISASRPVEVFGGHDCTDIPYNVTWCDHIEEAMLPVETLSAQYLVTTPWIALSMTKDQVVRVIATQAGTTLTYDPPNPAWPSTISTAGSYVELGPTSTSFAVTATSKILVSQYMLGQAYGGGAGDPAMALAVPVEQYRNSYLFHAPTSYLANFVNIMVPTGSVVTLDGTAIPAGSFAPIGATGFSVARSALSGAGTGNHSITSADDFGISVYGYGPYTSYWYPGGLDLAVLP